MPYIHRTPEQMFNDALEHALKVSQRECILIENEDGTDATPADAEMYMQDHKAYAEYLKSLVPTNGNIIKTMYPNSTWWVTEDNEIFTEYKSGKRVYFDLDWWNERYKREE